eukprot:UN10359
MVVIGTLISVRSSSDNHGNLKSFFSFQSHLGCLRPRSDFPRTLPWVSNYSPPAV